jgi:very-short-patch-repair endonuclease
MKLSKAEKQFIEGQRKFVKTIGKSEKLIAFRKKSKASKGEQSVIDFLTAERIDFKREYFFKGLYNTSKSSLLFFDFYLPDHNLCIEFDGQQHYGKEKTQRQKENDFLKNAYCNKNKIHLLRIKYTDIENVAKIICEKFDKINPIPGT